MAKIDWKMIGRTALAVGEQLFPVIKVVESLTKFKKLSSKEKQDLAFQALHDDLISTLLPHEAQDPRVEQAIRKLIDDAVEFNNLVAELRAQPK